MFVVWTPDLINISHLRIRQFVPDYLYVDNLGNKILLLTSLENSQKIAKFFISIFKDSVGIGQ